MIRKIKVMCYMLSIGEMSEEEFRRRAASYRGILEHCDSEGLKKALNDIYLSYKKPIEEQGIQLAELVVPDETKPKDNTQEANSIEPTGTH